MGGFGNFIKDRNYFYYKNIINFLNNEISTSSY